MSALVWGIGPQVNKFEQVSSDDHQMSLAGMRMSRQWVCPGGGYVQRGVGMSRGGMSRGVRVIPRFLVCTSFCHDKSEGY